LYGDSLISQYKQQHRLTRLEGGAHNDRYFVEKSANLKNLSPISS